MHGYGVYTETNYGLLAARDNGQHDQTIVLLCERMRENERTTRD